MRDLYLIRCLCVFSVWLFSLGVAFGQQIDTTAYHELSGVEVVEKVRPSVTREGTPLQIMDRAGIDRLGVQDLSEAVKRFSGVTVQDYGGIGGLKTVSVRSLGAKHTAVSYDGVTITDAQSGQVDISRFSLDNVEMVSLSIGQSDDIFQTARVYASAGALNIQTGKPTFKDKSFHTYLKVKGGSFGLFNPVLHYDQKLGKRWSASLHGDFVRADGQYPYTLINGELETREKRRNSDIHAYHLEGNLFGDFGRGGELSFKAYYFDSERGLPGSVNLYNKNTSERLWDNNFFVQSGYKNVLNEKFTLRAMAKYNYAFTRYLDINDKYAAGEQVDLNTQNEYYGSVGLLYTPIKYVSAVEKVAETLGNSMKRLNEPNLVTIFVGIVLGIIVGSLPISFPGIPQPVKLGLAGGPLIVAILISRFGYRYKLVTYTTQSSNLLLRELGITLFLACVGLSAGEGFVDTIVNKGGVAWIGYGFIITLLPLLIIGCVGRYFYKLNYFTLMGLIAGSTTDPPALAYSNMAAGNDAPAVGYATVYPLTMFLRVLTAQLMILFFYT